MYAGGGNKIIFGNGTKLSVESRKFDVLWLKHNFLIFRIMLIIVSRVGLLEIHCRCNIIYIQNVDPKMSQTLRSCKAGYNLII